ncbi:MAG: hypothetical protein V7707_20150 [Motiliproteus sp.]
MTNSIKQAVHQLKAANSNWLQAYERQQAVEADYRSLDSQGYLKGNAQRWIDQAEERMKKANKVINLLLAQWVSNADFRSLAEPTGLLDGIDYGDFGVSDHLRPLTAIA